jgi:hypothetical protein
MARAGQVSPGRLERHGRLPRLGLPRLGAPAVREPISRRNAPSRSAPSTALLALADAGSARTTTSAPAGRLANRCRMRCRNRRCTRCRTTEPPTARATTKPTWGGPVSGGPVSDGTGPAPAHAKCTTRQPHADRRPRRTAVAKSSRRVSRLAAGSNARCPPKANVPNANASGRQLSAALAAPSREDGPPGAGAHAQPEPVGPRPATVVRLERTFALGHGCRSPSARCALGATAGLRVVRSSPAGTGGTAASRAHPLLATTSGCQRGHARMARRWAGDAA